MEMFELCTLLLTYALCFSCHVLYLFIISWALTFTMFINWVKYDYAINVYLCIGWMHSIVCLFCCVGINDNSMLKTLKSLQNLPNAIFIYGTLKRGQPNHYVLEKFGNHIFFGTGCTELRYPLIIDRDSNLPFLLDSPGKGQVHCILLLIASICSSIIIVIFVWLVLRWTLPFLRECFMLVDSALHDRQLPDQCWVVSDLIQWFGARCGMVGLIDGSSPLAKGPSHAYVKTT